MLREIDSSKDNYLARLVKYIPSEVVALWLVVTGLFESTQASDDFERNFVIVVFVVMLIGTFLYLRFVQKVTKIAQLAVSTISFAVWVFATGGLDMFFANDPDSQANITLIKAVVMAIWTFFIPIFQAIPNSLSRWN